MSLAFKEKIKYLTRVFGESKLQNNGIELGVRCPKCGKPGKKKLCIRLDTDLYHCWVCNIKGRSIIRLIQKYKPAFVQEYVSKFGNKTLSLPLKETTIQEKVTLPQDFKLVVENLWDPDALAIKKYAQTRGFTDSMLWRFRIGYSSSNTLRRRMIIPSFDFGGNLNYWVARAIQKTNPIRYINAKIPKTRVIFNEIDIDWTQPIFLVEGPLDLMKCNMNSTCILGSSLQPGDKLFNEIVLNRTKVIICLDPDARLKQSKIADLFFSYDIDVSVINLKSGDIGELNPDIVQNLVANSHPWNCNSSLFERIKYL